MKPHRPKDVKAEAPTSAPITGAASTVISDVINTTEHGRFGLVVSVRTSLVTAGAGITFIVQESVFPSDAGSWSNVKTSAAISAAGYTHLKISHTITADQPLLPLLPFIRVVLETGAGSVVTVNNVWVSEPS